MEEIPSEFGGSRVTETVVVVSSSNRSDTIIVVAVITCFILILYFAFRYASSFPMLLSRIRDRCRRLSMITA